MLKKFGAGVFALLLVLFCAVAMVIVAQQAKPATPKTPPTVATPDDDQDDADREDPCPGAHTQFDLNQCAANARDRADAELNKVYRELLKDAGATERAKLRSAQLAWIKFRDAQCDYESFGNKGGSMFPMVYSFCVAKVTTARNTHLREILRQQLELFGAGQRSN